MSRQARSECCVLHVREVRLFILHLVHTPLLIDARDAFFRLSHCHLLCAAIVLLRLLWAGGARVVSCRT
jgi:hypothetical protein